MKTFREFRNIDEAFKKQNIDTLVKKLEQMTDDNEHGEALLHLAKQLNSSTYIDVMEGLIKIHYGLGHMPSELMKFRDSVYKELMKLVKKRYSKEDYTKIHGAF